MRGNAPTTKVHYAGKEDDFIIFIDDVEEFQKWQKDKSIPIAQFISGWKIFVTHKHGAQGTLDGASNQLMDNEFGTHKEEEVVRMILEKGTVKESEVRLLFFDGFYSSFLLSFAARTMVNPYLMNNVLLAVASQRAQLGSTVAGEMDR
ncbi:MAG: translational elongation factor EF-1 alpha [Watsoniomyces obsoletus]|nr:MAG: translational elongation factor EF-1 alpha [Watsoniomyces obsoletus]